MKYKEYLKEISNTVAYWISPSGKIIDVATNHIDVVIKNPQAFGLTDEKIKETYEKYGEEMGREGQAREELILWLVKKGWIRVRRYRNDGYSINVGRMSKKVKDSLFSWATKLLNTGINGMKEKDKYMPVKILGFQDRFSRNMTIQDVAQDALYEGKETFDPKNEIVIVEDANDLHSY
jgi:hypothetical protein